MKPVLFVLVRIFFVFIASGNLFADEEVVVEKKHCLFGDPSHCHAEVGGNFSGDNSLVMYEQALVRYLNESGQCALRAKLMALYNDLKSIDDVFYQQVREKQEVYETPEPEYPFLFLQLPLLKKLKKFSCVKTIEIGWSWFVRFYWLTFLARAVVQMGLYGIYAYNTEHNEKITGPWLDDGVDNEYQEVYGDYYMPLDVRKMWEYGPKHKKFHAVLALLSAGYAGIRFKEEVQGYVREEADWKKEWQDFAYVAQGFTFIRHIYECVATDYMIRGYRPCAALYDFFEKTVGSDKELAECVGLFESVALDPVQGSHFFSGYMHRCKELFYKKHAAFMPLTQAVCALNGALCGDFLFSTKL